MIKEPSIAANRNVKFLSKKTSQKNNENGSNHGLLESFPSDHLKGFIDDREFLKVLVEVKNGNFSVRMPIDQIGLSGKICDTLNEIISINEKMMQEFTRAGNTIGKQGKLTQRIELPAAKDPGQQVLIL